MPVLKLLTPWQTLETAHEWKGKILNKCAMPECAGAVFSLSDTAG